MFTAKKAKGNQHRSPRSEPAPKWQPPSDGANLRLCPLLRQPCQEACAWRNGAECAVVCIAKESFMTAELTLRAHLERGGALPDFIAPSASDNTPRGADGGGGT